MRRNGLHNGAHRLFAGRRILIAPDSQASTMAKPTCRLWDYLDFDAGSNVAPFSVPPAIPSPSSGVDLIVHQRSAAAEAGLVAQVFRRNSNGSMPWIRSSSMWIARVVCSGRQSAIRPLAQWSFVGWLDDLIGNVVWRSDPRRTRL